MKKLLLAMMLIVAPYATWAQGWPEKYGGVMLQGFYWDSYEDTKWTNLESQADVLSKYFDLIWVPQSGWCNGDYQMGYAPVWWFDHKSAFGTEAELRSMITTYKKGRRHHRRRGDKPSEREHQLVRLPHGDLE